MRRFPVLSIGALFAFALLDAAPARADTIIVCESRNGGYRSCPADTRGGVWLARQLSQAGCWEGDTWGYDRNRIWVNNGCRAEFRIGERPRGNNGAAVAGAIIAGAIIGAAIAHHDNRPDNRPPPAGLDLRTFRCESRDQRLTWCGERIGRREHVEVRRQLSHAPCVYGRSWGVSRRDVWVSNGCRAEFAVY